MSCHPHPLCFRMCPLVSVIKKDSAEFHSLKSKDSIGRLFASLSPKGAPCGLAPPVRVCKRRWESVRQREGSGLVDNFWLPSDLQVKLLSAQLSLGSCVPGRESCQQSVSTPSHGLDARRQTHGGEGPDELHFLAPSSGCSRHTKVHNVGSSQSPGTHNFSGPFRETKGGYLFMGCGLSDLYTA